MFFQKTKRSFFIFVVILISLSCSLVAKEVSYSDAMVRAAVIFGILRFTTWPEAKNSDESITLCTYGSSPTDAALSQLESIPQIGKKTVILKANIAKEEFSNCHVVIVGHKYIKKIELSHSTLFICDECDTPNNAVYGINLVRQDNRIQFSVDLDCIKEQGINFSASLIELAASCSSSDVNIRACNE